MFSGKSSRLLLELERLKYQHKRVSVFKPVLDDRYSPNEVVTHGGWSAPATVVRTGADILGALEELAEEPHVVAVDEAFMIPNVAEVLTWLFCNGVSIIVSTLDMGAHGRPFPEVEKLLPWATKVEKCPAVCTVCGSDAHYTHKKQGDGEDERIIDVGGAELYEPRCFSHAPAINKGQVVSK